MKGHWTICYRRPQFFHFDVTTYRNWRLLSNMQIFILRENTHRASMYKYVWEIRFSIHRIIVYGKIEIVLLLSFVMRHNINYFLLIYAIHYLHFLISPTLSNSLRSEVMVIPWVFVLQLTLSSFITVTTHLLLLRIMNTKTSHTTLFIIALAASTAPSLILKKLKNSLKVFYI